jgi:hypothetical protein
MLNNGIIKTFAVAAVLGLAACGGQQDATVIEQQPAAEEPVMAPEASPTMETDPMLTDTIPAEHGAEHEAPASY